MRSEEYTFHSFFEKMKDEYGIPEYVIGVTFGVDLDKWREILKTVYGSDFSERIVFNKAFLFTDKVYIKDKNRNRDLFHGNLLYAIPSVKGYLHTKFVLLCYKDKFVLVLSTKNINGNTSYDCILPFIFTECENRDEKTHGKRLSDYLRYLTEKTSDSAIPNEINAYIDKIRIFSITKSLENFKVTNFEIAYDENRFTNDLWKRVCTSITVIN